MGFAAHAEGTGGNSMALKDVVMIVGIIAALLVAAVLLTETRE